MNRGVNHMDVFFDDADRIEFGARLSDIHQRFGVETHAYCLMGNHYHLLLHCPEGALSDSMQRLGSVYTRHVNDRLGRDGPIFRGRFHSRLVESDAHLLAACRYIHRNPLELPGVAVPDDYRWSSHRTYLGLRRRPPWMHIDVVLDLVGGEAAFDQLVCSAECGRAFMALGERDIRHLVDAAAMVLAERAAASSDALGSNARSVVLAWAAGNPAVDDELVAAALGISGPGGWRSAVFRARAKVQGSAEMNELIQRAVSLIAPPAD
jgi:REP element-mobilizing transposase RayT